MVQVQNDTKVENGLLLDLELKSKNLLSIIMHNYAVLYDFNMQ